MIEQLNDDEQDLFLFGGNIDITVSSIYCYYKDVSIRSRNLECFI